MILRKHKALATNGEGLLFYFFGLKKQNNICISDVQVLHK